MLAALLACLATGIAAGAGRRTHSVVTMLDQWRRWRGNGFGTPTATAADESMRFGLFLVHLMPLAQNQSYLVGPTPYADMSFREWESVWTESLDRNPGLLQNAPLEHNHGLRHQAKDTLPDQSMAVVGSWTLAPRFKAVTGVVEQAQLTWPVSRPQNRGCGRVSTCASLR